MVYFGRIAILVPGKHRPARRRETGPVATVNIRSNPFDDADHPTLKDLRDKAVEDIAEWLGLEGVPPQLWKILGTEPDPAAAFIYFIRSIGSDPKKARRRDPAELLRLKRITEVLFSWSRLRDAGDPQLARRMQAVMIWGAPHELDLFRDNVDALATIIGLFEALDA